MTKKARLRPIGSHCIHAVLAMACPFAAACGGSSLAIQTSPDAQPPLDASTDVLVAADTATDSDSAPTTDGATLDGSAFEAGGDAGATPPAFPQVPNVGNTTLVSAGLVTIVAANDVLGTTLPSFSDAFVSSQVGTQIAAEYGLGTMTSTVHIVGPAMSGPQTTGDIADYVSAAIAFDGGPVGNGKTIFVVYLPDAASFASPDNAWAGYHAPFPNVGSTLGDQMAIVQREAPDPGGETQLGELTRVASHEIVESATDPLDQGYNLGETPATQPWAASIWQSWAPSGHVELADLCEGTRVFEEVDGGPAGGWEYQRIWSNAAAAKGGVSPCIPPPTTPYFVATVPSGWYALPSSGTISIPLTGWATSVTSDWRVKVDSDYARGTGSFSGEALDGGDVTTSLGIMTIAGCSNRFQMNSGAGGTIEVAAPPGAVSGDYAVLWVASYHDASNCEPPLSEDEVHRWPFGVYVQ